MLKHTSKIQEKNKKLTVGVIKIQERNREKLQKWEKPRKKTEKNQGNEDLKEKENTVRSHRRY